MIIYNSEISKIKWKPYISGYNPSFNVSCTLCNSSTSFPYRKKITCYGVEYLIHIDSPNNHYSTTTYCFFISGSEPDKYLQTNGHYGHQGHRVIPNKKIFELSDIYKIRACIQHQGCGHCGYTCVGLQLYDYSSCCVIGTLYNNGYILNTGSCCFFEQLANLELDRTNCLVKFSNDRGNYCNISYSGHNICDLRIARCYWNSYNNGQYGIYKELGSGNFISKDKIYNNTILKI